MPGPRIRNKVVGNEGDVDAGGNYNSYDKVSKPLPVIAEQRKSSAPRKQKGQFATKASQKRHPATRHY